MTEDFPEPREIIADLQRIVTPDGIQESYQLRAGGIDHWVYARGHDRSNPVILFVHGGPASPLAPAAWEFQRPIEEYFTVVTYDQRGAGRTFRAVDPPRSRTRSRSRSTSTTRSSSPSRSRTGTASPS